MWRILAKEKWHDMFMLFTVNNTEVLQRFVSSFTSVHDSSLVLCVGLLHRLIKLKNNFFLDNKERIINLRAERHTYTLVYRCILCIWANTSCKNLSFSIKCIFSLHVNFSFRKFVYHLLCHYLLKKYCWLWRMQFFFFNLSQLLKTDVLKASTKRRLFMNTLAQ